MSNIQIGDVDLDKINDRSLLEWMQDKKNNIGYRGGYKIRDNTAKIWLAIMRTLDAQSPPMTVRGIYYNCENVYRVCDKTDAGYKAIAKQVLNMRRAGILPYDFVTDGTRWMRKPTTYKGLRDCLETTKELYRRNLWHSQKDYCEIWCEKDAISGILYEITSKWDVPLYPSRGYSSDTFLFEAAEAIKSIDKPTYIYYFGDWDRCGLIISDKIEQKLSDFGAKVNFKRLAVTNEQIEDLNLPTREPKPNDLKHGWVGDCTEVDAIPANLLRELVENCITSHIDERDYQQIKRTEELERKTFESLIKELGTSI